MSSDTWTHRLARLMVRPLIGTGVTPNHLTTLRLLTGLAACACLALVSHLADRRDLLGWGGALWIVSAFLDRADGELARIGSMMSPGGHRYDYLVDNGINGLFFLATGIGLTDAHLFGHRLGLWSLAIGGLASVALLACNVMSERYERRMPGGERVFEGAWGFHLDDALYLLGPAAWFGLLLPILIGAAIGASIMALVVLTKLRHLPRVSASVPVI